MILLYQPVLQDGDVRAAILDLIGTDEDVMTSIVDSVSQLIVSKLLANESFIAKLADGLMKDGVLDAIKQNVYEACALDNEKYSSAVESLERKVDDLDNDNRALREDIDSIEQYSRRNCLVVHGIPESKEDSRDAALHVFNGRLDVPVTPHCIDRSHRLGRFQPSSNKPRPVIVKFVSYETSSVLGKATPQGNQNCDNGESHEAEKRPTEPDESTARHQGGMDD